MKEILSLVGEYIRDKQITKWKIGDQVNYAGTHFDEREYVAAVESILSGWFGLGKAGSHFESMFPRELGKKFGILTNSGSSANLLMYASLKSKRSYNLPEGTKILTPVAGFPTTINPIIQLGFVPIFVDIELDTLNLDLNKCEKLIQEHDVKVLSFAHVLGNPPNMDHVMYLVDKYKLILLEDCCDALGTRYADKFIGSFGSMATCSFYPAHHISLGEGGFVATNSTDQHTILKSFRDWGRGCYCQGSAANNLKCGTCGIRFSEWLPELKGEVFDHKYVYDEIGYNLKPIEMQAAIGLQQLKKLGTIIAQRKYNFKRLFYIYETYSDYFILPVATDKSDPSWFAFPLTIKTNAPFTRNEYVNYLESKNIQTRPYFAGNILLQPGYSGIARNYNVNDYPNATYVTTNTFFHGVSPVINDDQLDYIDDVVTEFMRNYK